MIEFIDTHDCIEYKNGCFATVFKVMYMGVHMGYYYNDRGHKNWFQFFLDESKHNECIDIVEEYAPHTTHFGEDCIYTHGIYSAQNIAEELYNRYYIKLTLKH
jgi:hypothetical protein